MAMPLSWLPLISDYTREAKRPVQATAVSVIIYGVVSCWMYVIGMGAASAGVSAESLSKKFNSRWVAVAVTIIGTFGAIFLPLYDITDFLYFIGSVFAPMIAIQIADFFLLKKNTENLSVNVQNLAIWLVGFIIYRLLMQVDILVGNTLPNMAITILICVAVNKIRSKTQDNNAKHHDKHLSS